MAFKNIFTSGQAGSEGEMSASKVGACCSKMS